MLQKDFHWSPDMRSWDSQQNFPSSSENTFEQTMILNTVSIHTVNFCRDDPLGGRELEKCFNFLCCSAAVVHQEGQMNISVFLGRQAFAFVLSVAERAAERIFK